MQTEKCSYRDICLDFQRDEVSFVCFNPPFNYRAVCDIYEKQIDGSSVKAKEQKETPKEKKKNKKKKKIGLPEPINGEE